MVYSNDSGSGRWIPAHFSCVYSEREISSRIKALGEEISSWCEGVWRDSHTDVLALPVMRGGIFFFADIARQLTTSVEIAPIKVQAYEPGSNGVKRESLGVDIESLAVKGRVVLVVDDVCDSGRTLEALEKELLARGAREVRTVVLVRRLLDTPSFVPCWVGFQYKGPEWIVGFGMDDNGRWRNLPGVYVIKRDE